MTTNFYPGNLQWLGIAKETTYNTPATTPTFFIPVDSPQWTPTTTALTDQSLRNSMATDFSQIQGMRYDVASYTTHIYSETAYLAMLAILGNPDTVTGAADPYTHSTSLLNQGTNKNGQPNSWTLWMQLANGKTVQISGAVVVEAKVTVAADGLPTIDMTWNGMPGAFTTAPANTPADIEPFPAWTGSITVAGVSLDKYSSIELDYKRGTKPIPVLNGTQAPLAIYAGEFSVSINLDGVFQGTTDNDITDFLANTQPAIIVSIHPEDDAVHTLTFQHSLCAYDSSAPQGTNSGWVTVQSVLKALANTTDALDGSFSPVQVTFVSAQSTAY